MAFHFLSSQVKSVQKTYTALQGETGKPQSANDAIDKLCDRLANGATPEDRRGALLGIKGLARDYKQDAGNAVLPILLTMLERDAPEDAELAKVVLETLNVLCETEEPAPGVKQSRAALARQEASPGLRNTDRFLASERPSHALLSLLATQHFYVRYFSLQLLGTLLSSRPEPVQKHVLSAPGGIGNLVDVLDDKREIIRNEGLLLLISLASTNADIQKIVAFVGAFDKLLNIIEQEGGLASGGIVVQDCLAGIVGLLRYNPSNQNYFRETTCIPHLAPLLQFPPHALIDPSESTNPPDPTTLSPEAQHGLSTFASQYWPEQKSTNAQLVLGLIRMLVGGAGEGRSANSKALLQSGITRCLLELSLASNAPTALKAHALNALADLFKGSPVNQDLLTNLSVQPMIPVYAEEGDGQEEPEWQRAQPVPATLALIALAVQGDPGLGMDASGLDGIAVRAAAVGLFESYVANNPDAQVTIVSEMAPVKQKPGQPLVPQPQTAGSVLLAGLRAVPTSLTTQLFDSHAPLFASLMFAQLLRNTESCKRIAREISIAAEEDDEEKIGLVQVLVGNLMLAQREQAQCQSNLQGHPAVEKLSIEWSRVMVGYLQVLAVWCWESPRTVKDFLSEGANLQVLIQPIAQASGVDSVVQGLCAFLLGILYEYNREAGTIDRATMHPILHSRVGPDQFVNRITRLREDIRFKNVGPEVLEMNEDDQDVQDLREDGFWFDWAFVEFARNDYLSVQRAILLDPGSSIASGSFDAAESAELIANLRVTISQQKSDLEQLQQRVSEVEADRTAERKSHESAIDGLQKQVDEAGESSRTLATEREEQLVTLNSQLVVMRTDMESAKATAESKDKELADKTKAIEDLQRQLQEVSSVTPNTSELDNLKSSLVEAQSKQADSEKEQEDLLMLLEELSAKRKADKAKMREAKLDVSDDEEEEDEEQEADS